ncbi:hypothetical protein [Pontiella sulfatireligans]|uniref:Uncharacterized protein n=1 Tax=Pontiella sulfatireligans TaxID=2750658 RepID=A0A6C2UL98_9BACT|nr:hypothetical protein [Pontiella sulfatireligans]VGO21012.1 hypothetical protein SCARR_03081 [Pontiella sulfatireligans]
MKKIIIAIHGLGNKPDAALLRASWLKAIGEGLARRGKQKLNIPFEMVYWADISYPAPLSPEIDAPSDPLFLAEPYTASPEQSQKRRHLHAFALKFIETHLDRLFLKKDLSETFPGASAKMMAHHFSELDFYYTDECRSLKNEDCSAKAAIQARLRDTLQTYAGYEILLLSHSMGSIIAFDVLWDPSVNFKIHTLVTMGSPLGLPPIVARNFKAQQSLFPELKQPTAPECVWPHWYNLSDLRDTVALDHTLRDDYAANSKGLRAIDLLAANDYEVNSHPNPHKSYGYLRTPETARIIKAFLTSRRHDFIRRKCDLIVGGIAASTRRFWKGASGK